MIRLDEGEMFWLDNCPATPNQGVFDDVLEFPNVAGKVVVRQGFEYPLSVVPAE